MHRPAMIKPTVNHHHHHHHYHHHHEATRSVKTAIGEQ